MGNDITGFFDDDGTKINPELVTKSSLCITCRKNDVGGKEEMLCILNRIDQKGEKDFQCEAYEPKLK